MQFFLLVQLPASPLAGKAILRGRRVPSRFRASTFRLSNSEFKRCIHASMSSHVGSWKHSNLLTVDRAAYQSYQSTLITYSCRLDRATGVAQCLLFSCSRKPDVFGTHESLSRSGGVDVNILRATPFVGMCACCISWSHSNFRRLQEDLRHRKAYRHLELAKLPFLRVCGRRGNCLQRLTFDQAEQSQARQDGFMHPQCVWWTRHRSSNRQPRTDFNGSEK